MSGAIAVFVKTPGYSPVKTRLAVKLGQETAESFHLLSARSVAEVVNHSCQSSDVEAYFAVAEKTALSHKYWQQLPVLWQGDGGLGERMAHIYQTLMCRYDYVIIVGADIPQMTVGCIQSAISSLNHFHQPRLVFAPSVDGGFWLVGGNTGIATTNWTNVAYSEADTGQQFLAGIRQICEVKVLNTLADVDEAEDLKSLLFQFGNMKQMLPAQQKLKDFLQTLSLDGV